MDGVSFELSRGESFRLVGESGCGKTTTGKLLVRLLPPTGGHIVFDDGEGGPADIAVLKGKTLKAFRRKAQMIFQDPYESMNPRRTIFDTVAEPLSVHKMGGPAERLDRVSQMLEVVGVDAAPDLPLQIPPRVVPAASASGWRLQGRWSLGLPFVVADEPTSMLDVSIRTGGHASYGRPGGPPWD